MQSPEKMKADAFIAAIAESWARRKCEQCNRPFLYAPVYVSIHAEEFGDVCAGEGRCIKVLLPFCRKCEPRPALKGCIHHPLYAGLMTQEVKHEL